jgi:hypothetical protein
MKKALFTLVLGLIALMPLMALDIVYPEHFNEDTMTIQGPALADLEGGEWETEWIELNNDTDAAVTIELKYLNADVPNGWSISFCNDAGTCYMPNFDVPVEIPANGTFRVHYVFYYGESDATFAVPFLVDGTEYAWTFTSEQSSGGEDFEIVYPEHFNEETMTIQGPALADLEGGEWETEWIEFNNNTDSAMNILLRYSNTEVPNGWSISFCNDAGTCYMPNFDVPVEIPANGTFRMHYVFYYGESDATFPVPFSIDGTEYAWTFTSEGVDNEDDVIASHIAKLGQNYPNPFNPTTTLSYSLSQKQAKDAKISIYNSRGQLVKTFTNLTTDGAKGNVTWNGNDNSGKSVTSGIYYYRLSGNGFSDSKKMVLMK